MELADALGRLRRALPTGHSLPESSWRRRHAGVLVLLWCHAGGLAAFAVQQGFDGLHALTEGGVIAGFALVATSAALPRRWRAVIASAGLMSSSAILVHLSGGYIEAHFHFFVMLGVIALYEDWTPFLFAIGYVAVHHGVLGTLDPASVYNHPAAYAAPWTWALIHATFVLGLSCAIIVTWRVTEQARFRAQQVLDSAGEAILGVDGSGRVSFANPAASELTRRSLGDLIGRHAADILSKADGAAGTVTRIDGETVSVEWVATPMRGADGEVLAIRDVAERKRAEQELAEARRQVAMSEKLSALGTLVSGVAHEIRTPLTYTSNNLHVAQIRLARALDRASEEVRRELLDVPVALDESLEGVERINRLVEDLRRFTRLPTGQRAPARLDDVVREAVALFQATHRGHAEVVTDLAPVPPMTMDRAQVQQVVLNLLENADDAMRHGGTIRVAARVARGGAELVVTDEGPGITPQVEERMFDPFFTTKAEGTGLGLSIVRRIVEAHGGEIRCVSIPGRGATFTLRLPSASASVAEPAVAATS